MNLLTSGLLIWLLGQLQNPSLFRRVMLAAAVGMVGFMFFPYSNFIWFKNPDIFAHLVDALVPFSVVGLVGHAFLRSRT